MCSPRYQPEFVKGFKDAQGAFLLLRRNDAVKKKGHIIYRSSKFEYIEGFGGSVESEYVAVFDSSGEVVPLSSVEDECAF